MSIFDPIRLRIVHLKTNSCDRSNKWTGRAKSKWHFIFITLFIGVIAFIAFGVPEPQGGCGGDVSDLETLPTEQSQAAVEPYCSCKCAVREGLYSRKKIERNIANDYEIEEYRDKYLCKKAEQHILGGFKECSEKNLNFKVEKIYSQKIADSKEIESKYMCETLVRSFQNYDPGLKCDGYAKITAKKYEIDIIGAGATLDTRKIPRGTTNNWVPCNWSTDSEYCKKYTEEQKRIQSYSDDGGKYDECVWMDSNNNKNKK